MKLTVGDVFMYSNCVMKYFFPTESDHYTFLHRGKLNIFLFLPVHVIKQCLSLVILMYIHRYAGADSKSISVMCLNRALSDKTFFRSRSFFSLVFIVQLHFPLWKGHFHSRQRSLNSRLN